ncbi:MULTISPECIES: D-alanine--D-alanine ligase family protein [unclassified Pseudactinotalea]|uniref:D-alanine--D-alanine ligase family protein n=1 Tax=unclassified Pseudactinotalea TaxID=2649176 RepID=UPI00128DB650|nr:MULTISPECIES: D-alanine--D-alanine ligase family protein [unclassified Pseudactinotalea]MPV50404.1 D-alanine--D-alanine ligase [Pseudactinotalea sp. HY160]QGH68996.1 D-alanine--D-alanine ligase [Pseudactinotalea sp. HY158]
MTHLPRARVAVLFGGQSSEHAISCATAAGVLTAIDRDRFDVIPVGITRAGHWLLLPDDPERLQLGPGHVPAVEEGDGPRVTLTGDRRLIATGGADIDDQGIDVVLPLLHGPYGEDGTIQGLLELAWMPYVGSGVLASAVGMDKQYMKAVLAAADLPIGPHEVITNRQWQTNRERSVARVAELGLPLFVKPCRAGSSIGITKVTRVEELEAAIEAAREHDPKVMVEAAIDGREIEVAVLEGRDYGPPRVTAPGEIAVVGDYDFYDYQAKYFDSGSAALSFPAELPGLITERAKGLAARAFDAVGGEGLARVDLFYTTAGELIVNEINTMPGFTPISMYPMMWQRSGMPYAALITELIDLALARSPGLR